MEYLTGENIITVIVALVMLVCLKKIFKGDLGDNKVGPILLFIILGAALYVWKSGVASEIVSGLFGSSR